jgi:hypothetical protein
MKEKGADVKLICDRLGARAERAKSYFHLRGDPYANVRAA